MGWEGYATWNDKRFKAIQLRIEDGLSGRVCDLGAGHGYFSERCWRLGANVLSVEGKAEHAREVKNLADGRWAVEEMNLEDSFPQGKFDVILCLGLLYHVRNPEALLRRCCEPLSSIVVVETAVLDNEDDEGLLFRTDTESLSGIGCWPTSGWMEKRLRLFGRNPERIFGPDLNDGFHRYDWVPGWSMQYEGRRAMWLCR